MVPTCAFCFLSQINYKDTFGSGKVQIFAQIFIERFFKFLFQNKNSKHKNSLILDLKSKPIFWRLIIADDSQGLSIEFWFFSHPEEAGVKLCKKKVFFSLFFNKLHLWTIFSLYFHKLHQNILYLNPIEYENLKILSILKQDK